MVTIIDPALKDGANDNFVVNNHEIIRLGDWKYSVFVKDIMEENYSQIIIFQTPSGETKIEYIKICNPIRGWVKPCVTDFLQLWISYGHFNNRIIKAPKPRRGFINQRHWNKRLQFVVHPVSWKNWQLLRIS